MNAAFRMRRCGTGVVSAATAIALVFTSILFAPSAAADSTDSLRAAVLSMRGTSCGQPLRFDPVVEQVAANVNDSTDKWVSFTARAVPVPDPLPVLKDYGYGGGKATMLQGAGDTDGKAIKGLLLQGYAKIPDCSYTDYGVSVVRNELTGYFLTTLVLAGA